MEDNGSKNFALSKADWKKIGKGAVVAGVGGVIAYFLSDVVPQIGSDKDTTIILTAGAAVLLNLLRKWVGDTSSSG